MAAFSPVSPAPLLLLVSGGFMPPRLLAVPAGTRLPRLALAVVPAAAEAGIIIPAAAVTGCVARRGVAVHAAAPPHASANLDPEEAFYRDLEEDAVRALKLLQFIKPPAALLGKAQELKALLDNSKAGAQARLPNKEELVIGLLHGVYGVVDLAEECTPRKSWMPPYLPTKFCQQAGGKATLVVGGGAAVTFDFRPEDIDAMMGAVCDAVNHAVAATGRCVGPDDIDKILPFADPEDW